MSSASSPYPRPVATKGPSEDGLFIHLHGLAHNRAARFVRPGWFEWGGGAGFVYPPPVYNENRTKVLNSPLAWRPVSIRREAFRG
jgi:hypothetical protein